MPGYRINVRNCQRAQVTANSTSSYTIGTPAAMPTLRSVDIALTSATGTLYGDGEKVSEIGLLTGATLNIGIDKLTSDDKVALLGATKNSSGVVTYKTTDKPVVTAMYMEIEHDDGGYEAIWLLCGKAQPLSVNAQQREDNITFSTETLTMNFVRREKDKALMKMADTDDTAFNTAAQTSFKTSPDI